MVYVIYFVKFEEPKNDILTICKDIFSILSIKEKVIAEPVWPGTAFQLLKYNQLVNLTWLNTIKECQNIHRIVEFYCFSNHWENAFQLSKGKKMTFKKLGLMFN